MAIPESEILRRAPEVIIRENEGYGEQELLGFLSHYPRVVQVMNADSLLFGKDSLRFPSQVAPEDEKADPELANRAFRRRVAMHTASVGLTMNSLLVGLGEAGAVDLDDMSLSLGTQAMTLHDLKKLNEILWRGALGSSDKAYDAAEAHCADLLRRAGLPEEYVQLAGSVGHNGARDFMTARHLWPLVRQAAYLSDDLHQETVIQADPLAKVRRLKGDARYAELNAAGFPDRAEYPGFSRVDGGLTPKFDIQEAATTQMLHNVGEALGVSGMDLGKYLIVKETGSGLYKAQFDLPTSSTGK